MHRVMLLNSKGGCGKTTIATNLAGYYASSGKNTVLIDHDGQGSGTHWLTTRPPQAPAIHGIEAYREAIGVTRSFLLRLPENTDRIVIDTPANVQGQQLADLVSRSDSIIVPVLSSQIDIDAASKFMRSFAQLPRVLNGDVRVAVVANRVRTHTVMYLDLERFLTHSGFAFAARLRDTQAYIRAAECGLGIHELRAGGARKDLDQWAPLIAWVEEGASETPDALGTAYCIRPAGKEKATSRQRAFAFSLKAEG